MTAPAAGARGGLPARSQGITDVHVHIQPWRQLKPDVMAAMRQGKEDHWEFLLALMDDPKALLEVMDRAAHVLQLLHPARGKAGHRLPAARHG